MLPWITIVLPIGLNPMENTNERRRKGQFKFAMSGTVTYRGLVQADHRHNRINRVTTNPKMICLLSSIYYSQFLTYHERQLQQSQSHCTERWQRINLWQQLNLLPLANESSYILAHGLFGPAIDTLICSVVVHHLYP